MASTNETSSSSLAQTIRWHSWHKEVVPVFALPCESLPLQLHQSKILFDASKYSVSLRQFGQSIIARFKEQLFQSFLKLFGRFQIQTRQLAAENWCWRKHRWEVRMSGCFPKQDVRTESQRCPINLSNRSVPS